MASTSDYRNNSLSDRMIAGQSTYEITSLVWEIGPYSSHITECSLGYISFLSWEWRYDFRTPHCCDSCKIKFHVLAQHSSANFCRSRWVLFWRGISQSGWLCKPRLPSFFQKAFCCKWHAQPKLLCRSFHQNFAWNKNYKTFAKCSARFDLIECLQTAVFAGCWRILSK